MVMVMVTTMCIKMLSLEIECKTINNNITVNNWLELLVMDENWGKIHSFSVSFSMYLW